MDFISSQSVEDMYVTYWQNMKSIRQFLTELEVHKVRKLAILPPRIPSYATTIGLSRQYFEWKIEI